MIWFIVLLSLVLIVQGVLTLMQMLYSWEHQERIEKTTSPHALASPKYSFTALIPARHEAGVIADTVHAIAKIKYPEYLKESFVICKDTDYETILAAHKAILETKLPNIHVLTFDGEVINKPHALNIGLQHATKEIIVVFDAEDEPHTDIYSVINTAFLQANVAVIQSGVQLMNFRSHWFSTLNVLEYYFWFKSSLQFFTSLGFMLLGGNTVFIKRRELLKVGGWDETCLTEDAELGIRLSAKNVSMKALYDARHTTREETPTSTWNFIKQRTRWNQGYLQVFAKGDWLKLPTVSMRVIAAYTLFWPVMQAMLFLFIPFSFISAITLNLPVWVTILSSLPLYLLLIQFITYTVGLYEFTHEYKLRYPIWMPVKLLLTFYPFQLLLGISTLRAFFRLLFGISGWEKTVHANAHRTAEFVQHAGIRSTYA